MFMRSTSARRCLLMLSVLAIAQSAKQPSVPKQNVVDRITASPYVKNLAGSEAITVREATAAETSGAMFKDFPAKDAKSLANSDYVAEYTPNSGAQQGKQQTIPVRAIPAKTGAVSDTNFALLFSDGTTEQPAAPVDPVDDAQKAKDADAIRADEDGALQKIIGSKSSVITNIVYMSGLKALKKSDDKLLAARSYIVTTASKIVQACVYDSAEKGKGAHLKVEVQELEDASQTSFKMPFFIASGAAIILLVAVVVMCCSGSSNSTQNTIV